MLAIKQQYTLTFIDISQMFYRKLATYIIILINDKLNIYTKTKKIYYKRITIITTLL